MNTLPPFAPAATFLACLFLNSAANAEVPGFRETTLGPDGIQAVIWYPAAPGGAPEIFAHNPVFTGVAGVGRAELLPGTYPLILASHGLGGHYRSLFWLTAGLAEKGAIVVAVNHPGSTFGDLEMPRGMKHWTRVEDLANAMAAVLADPEIGPSIDRSRIMATGFSYGGWTALSAGGLRGNLAGYADHCAKVGKASSHCADLAKWGFDFNYIDPKEWDASYRLPVVSRVAAIDPGLTWGIDDVAGLKVPALLIGLGDRADRLVATDTSGAGSGLATRLLAMRSDAREVVIAPAWHFTALLACTDKGAAILKEEGDDPVCTDPSGTDRAEVHARIVDEVAAFFGL
jgi:predicted dienelactone hydrolase